MRVGDLPCNLICVGIVEEVKFRSQGIVRTIERDVFVTFVCLIVAF